MRVDPRGEPFSRYAPYRILPGPSLASPRVSSCPEGSRDEVGVGASPQLCRLIFADPVCPSISSVNLGSTRPDWLAENAVLCELPLQGKYREYSFPFMVTGRRKTTPIRRGYTRPAVSCTLHAPSSNSRPKRQIRRSGISRYSGRYVTPYATDRLSRTSEKESLKGLPVRYRVL